MFYNLQSLKANYCLVQFIEDDIYHVCPKGHLKRGKSATILAKWSNKQFYPVKFLASSDNILLLTNLKRNLETNYPVVVLKNIIDTPSSSQIAESSVFIDQNTPVSLDLQKQEIWQENIICQHCGVLYNENDGQACCKGDSINDELLLDSNDDPWYNSQFHSEDEDEESEWELEDSNNKERKEDLASIQQNITDTEIQIIENVLLNNSFEDQTVQGTCLCMFCGIFVDNLAEHINLIHSEANINGMSYVQKSPSGGATILLLNAQDHYFKVANLHSASVQHIIKYPPKQHYCAYCRTLQSKLARHLERKHKNEDDVKEAIKLPKGSRERKLLLAEIQKKSDFVYNSKHIQTDETINLRRSGNILRVNVPCPYCNGFYSKKNIRNHVRLNCWKRHHEKEKQFEAMGLKNLQTMSRSVLSGIHEKASKTLREKIFPVLNNDEITRAIAYDELVIVYANLLVMKYSSSDHHHKMIRNKIRHISRILIAMRNIKPNIKNVTAIYDPSNFDTFIEAIHNLAGLKNGKFTAPSFGPTSISLICQIGDVLQIEAIKNKDESLEKITKQFLKLVVTTASALITKTATENRTQSQRSKVVVLPKTEDVRNLSHCLDFELERCIEQLNKNFDLTIWKTLNKVVLIKIMTFNRKRPGDVERSQIVEYENLQMLDNEILEKLESPKKKYALQFGRYITRGKLDFPAPVLVSKMDMKAIQLILKYRKEAKVDENNPYLFAAPPDSTDPFFKAGMALSDFCKLMNLQDKNLTATKLRKHLATVTCTFDADLVKRISNYMGHSEKYHSNIYVQRPVLGDVVEMGKVLTYAMGSTIDPKESITNDVSSKQNISLENSTFTTPEGSSEDDDEEYRPDLSKISEEGSDDEDVIIKSNKKTNTKRRKLIKPTRVTKRATWTTPERTAVRHIFRQYMCDEKVNPSLETCQEFIHGNSLLKNRNAVQIRAWIIQEKKRLKDKSPRWDTPTRELCRRHFKKHYDKESYPNSDELQSAINMYPDLRHTTIAKLRSHLQHDYFYLRRKKLFT